MNRLTDDQVAEGIKIIVNGLVAAGAEPAMSDRRYVRLAEYEQTGLSPEQVKELQQQKAEPVRHGHWIRGVSKGWPTNPTCLWYCSCCGEKIKYVDTSRIYQKTKKPVNEANPYCRKCGAKMDRSVDDEHS